MTVPYPMPKRLHNPEGTLRRVGVELELAGLDLDQLGGVVVHCFGGRHERDGRFVHHVRGTTLGDFVLELDAAVLKSAGYRELLRSLGLDSSFRERVDSAVERITGELVPHEIVSPPVPLDRLEEMEALRERLREAQALGTRASWRYAFGLHLNPEVASLEAEDITAHLKAYLLLSDRLREHGDIDLSRRVAPFIRDFPEDYARLVVAPDYWPDGQQLVADYCLHNPTRNRPLDLLPLFAHLDPGLLPEPLRNDPLLKPRPTFHYRLPNCAIDEPQWRLAHEWAGWLAVETLAGERAALARLGAEYLEFRKDPITGFDPAWAERTRGWLPD